MGFTRYTTRTLHSTATPGPSHPGTSARCTGDDYTPLSVYLPILPLPSLSPGPLETGGQALTPSPSSDSLWRGRWRGPAGSPFSDDYFKVEEPTFQVFTEEEITLGDLPKVEAKAPEKDNRQAKKNERLAARQNKAAAQGEENKKDPNDPSAALFGERELIRS